MGMIMKDGIPYGGIYPIDDAPTQGSNNAVKSGGVHSALSNKVDKVAGKGLSTNDYDNTEKEKNEANADAIEAIVNVYSSKNLAPIPGFYQKVEQGITWTVIREQGANNGKVTAVGTASAWSIVSTKKFFLPAGSYIISAGVSDIYHCYVQLANVSDGSLIATTYGKFSVSFELIHDTVLTIDYVIYEGATVNDVFAVQILDSRITDPTYVPYAMTNEELTDKVKDIYKEMSLIEANSAVNIDLSALTAIRPYLLMCSGMYNPLWRYMGLLCITDGGSGYLFDVVTDATLTVSVSGKTLTLRNNNYDNNQVVAITIIG